MDTSTLPPGDSGEVCENCDKTQFPKYFCADCGLGYCEDCWSKAKVHGQGRTNSNGVPHERINREVADLLKQIFTPPSDPIEQRKLHQTDADTIWFGVIRNVTGLPVLQDYGRYAKIMQESSTGEYPERWPQLVSFVGQTGAGKSTLVKTLVEYQRRLRTREEFPTPVAGSINDHAPTSGDVHLYADPFTYLSQHPVLYADCEGMDGGERTPIGATIRDHVITSKPASSMLPQLPKKIRKLPKSVKREMVWANNPEKCKREFAVKNLYPRLLYAFSDIVVFVLRNDRTFESAALVPMLQWAAASIEGSVNQSAMPHAIIVLNFTDPSIDPSGWTTSLATDSLLNTYSNAVWENNDVRTHARYWQERGTPVNTTKDLLLCYYSTVNVVRMPQKGRYALVDQQVVELNLQIQNKCTEARENRKRLRVTFNAEEFQAALSMGFDHFSKRLDAPFDFVELSWNLNPIPKDFGGNILRLALAIKDDSLMENATGPQIFQHLGHMVASCIMLDFVRHKLKGTASRLIYHYEECYMRALKEFCEDWWPCSFTNARGRCVNTQRGHAKGHQDGRGRILASGDYQTVESFNECNYAPVWHNTIEANLDNTREQMERMRRGELAMEEEAAAIRLHLKRMNEFYSNLGDISAYMNHSACFSCLRELPQHPLPCGHVLCTNCVRSFAHKASPITYAMDSCPLHDSQKWDREWEILVKPHLAGVRVLSLDGGGMRAILQIQILKEIQRHIDKVPIVRFFDLIVGTSTGGLVALGFGVENWSLSRCEERFEDLIFRAFAARELNGVPILESISTFKHKGKYKTRPFVEGLKDSFGDTQLFGGISDSDRYRRKVAVVSTTEAGQKAVILTNYNRPSQDADTNLQKVDYRFERPEKGDAEAKIWEVVRATTAATGYFKPFCNDRTGINYIDGGLYHNNPIRIANEERKLLWPDVQDQPPDLILSIGTACQRESKTSSEGMLSKYKSKMFKTALNRFDNTEDAENIWEQFLQEVRLPNSSSNRRYIRLNPKVKKQPQFDEIQEYWNFIHDTKMILKSLKYTSITRTIAHRLIASSFYFEKDMNKADENTVQGYILCRFPDDSPELEGLGKKFQDLKSHSFSPHFIISEQQQERGGITVEIPADNVAAMIRELTFSMEVTITSSSKVARTTISLCLGKDDEPLPISGFPRHLMTEERSVASPAPSRSKTKKAHPQVRRDATGNEDETNMTDTSSDYLPSWTRGYQSPEHASIAELPDTSTNISSSATIVSSLQEENAGFSLGGLFKFRNNSHASVASRQIEGDSSGTSNARVSEQVRRPKTLWRNAESGDRDDEDDQLPDVLRISDLVQQKPSTSRYEPELGSGARLKGKVTTKERDCLPPHAETPISPYSSSEDMQQLWSASSYDSVAGKLSTGPSPTQNRTASEAEAPGRLNEETGSRSGTSNYRPYNPYSNFNSGPSGRPKPPVPYKKASLGKFPATSPTNDSVAGGPPTRLSAPKPDIRRPAPVNVPPLPPLHGLPNRHSVDSWLETDIEPPPGPPPHRPRPNPFRSRGGDLSPNVPQHVNVQNLAGGLPTTLASSSRSEYPAEPYRADMTEEEELQLAIVRSMEIY